MAPTEVLAEQHYLGVRDLLDGFTVPDDRRRQPVRGAGVDRPLRVELLTNRTTAAERRRILAGLARAQVDLADRHPRARSRRASSSGRSAWW